MQFNRYGLTLVGSLTLVSAAFAGSETLRVATWNVSNYTGGRVSDIQNAVYGSFQGRSMSPDVIMAQEIQSSTAATAFVSALNGAGKVNDWAASYATLTGTSATNDAVVFYRTSKVSIGSTPTLVRASQGTAGTPRSIFRWDLKLANDSVNETLSLYDAHLKSGSATADDTRRQDATDAIRADANSLDASHHVIFGGDMNVQRSTQGSYQALVGSQSNNRGRFNDPISSPGTWNNNSNFRFLHTQDPTGDGGMDDRHDQLLLGSSLVDGTGLDYVGKFGTAYSTSTWDDANQSYRVWGNDGSSFDKALTTTGNLMVGESIAQSLKNVATSSGGHLPVFLDLKYQAVPEPTTLAVLGLGALGMLRRRRK